MTARRSRMTSATSWALILVVTLVLHGSALAMMYVGRVLPEDGGLGVTQKPKAALADAVDLKPTCTGDAMLATASRFAMCLAPWHDDADDCFYDAQMSLWMDVSSCEARNEPSATTVGLMEQKQVDKIKPIDPEPLLEMMQQQQQQQPPPPPPPPQVAQQQQQPPPPPQQRQMQVVENVKPNSEEEPDNARLLAEYNTKVDKEHVNRGAVNEPMVQRAKPEELTPKKDPKNDPSVKERDPDRLPGKDQKAPDVPGTLSMRHPGAPHPNEVAQEQKTRGQQGGKTDPASTDGMNQRRGDGDIEQEHRDHGEVPRGDGGAGGGQPQAPPKLTDEQLERIVGGGSVDHLDDVDNGDETALNAKRWVYASFFNRLKRQVAQNWDPATVWRRADPTGSVWGYKTRVTEVRVSLSPKGELAKIVVTGPSGVGDLDDEAIKAFKQAAPFPNPPEGLVSNKDNLITFAFSFYFEIGSPHTSWRVLRNM